MPTYIGLNCLALYSHAVSASKLIAVITTAILASTYSATQAYVLNKNGVPETIRTSDPLIKSQLLCQLSYEDIPDGADYRNRTHNLLITSQLLYLLS